jgi:hypothetical protein
MAQYLVFLARLQFSQFVSDFQLFGLSATEEISLDEMRIWCIKINIELVLH